MGIFSKAKEKALKAIDEAVENSKSVQERLDEAEDKKAFCLDIINANKVSNPDIFLKEKEACIFMADGAIGKKHKRTTSVSYAGPKARIKIAKGLSYTVGKSKIKGEKEEYWEQIPCKFYATTERFIAIVQQGSGFDIKLNKVIKINPYKDALEIYEGSKSRMVFLPPQDVKRYLDLSSILSVCKHYGVDEEDIRK